MRLLSSFRIAIVSALVLPALAFGWGFNGHRRLASKIHEPLPTGCLKSFLQTYASMTGFQEDACDPDRWRVSGSANYDPNEPPRHYLDIDYANPISSYPRDWAGVQARFGQFAVQNGQVPFRVEEMYGILVQRFQAGNAAAIAQQIAWMSHYVTDSFSPYHDTRYSDPKLNGSDTVGGHSRYESNMLGVSANINAIAAAANSHFGTVGRADPKNNIFDIIIVGNPLAGQIAQADSQGQGDLTALFNGTQDLTARRWGDALTLLSSLVLSAWVDAGKPLITGMPNGCSLVAPQGQLALRGFPLPPATVDGGVTDAGVPDSGTGGGSGGGSGGFNGGSGGGVGGGVGGGADGGGADGGGADGGGADGGGAVADEPRGCGCSSANGLLLLLPLIAFFAARRRRA